MIERRFRFFLGVGLPDLVQPFLCLRLQFLWQLVQHVGRLVNPTALLLTGRPHLFQGRPKSECPVGHRQFRRDGHATGFQVAQNAEPGLLAFALAIGQSDQLFRPIGAGTDDHEQARALVGQSHIAIDPIGPEVHERRLG